MKEGFQQLFRLAGPAIPRCGMQISMPLRGVDCELARRQCVQRYVAAEPLSLGSPSGIASSAWRNDMWPGSAKKLKADNLHHVMRRPTRA